MSKLDYPVKLKPAAKSYIWGGEKLKSQWNKISDLPNIAESWELSTFVGSESVIDGGEFANINLNQINAKQGKIFGKKADKFRDFPILIKLIDAKGDLSIQVHPSDDYALKNEKQLGKTEMWFIADCEKDASIFYGFNRDVSRDEVAQSIANNTICSLLNEVKVQPNDYFFVPSGTVHAIRQGITIIEIQESSSVTYRLYDYDRTDASGKKRELHIEKALDVLNYNRTKVDAPSKYFTNVGESKEALLAECEYFKVKEVGVYSNYTVDTKDSFASFTVIAGAGRINDINLQKGDTIFIPANVNATIKGNLRIILTTL